MVKISVVMPLYNKAPHILHAVNSVLSQTRQPFEIIVVDDGSTDGGADLLVPLVEQHGLVLIRQKNGGESLARNRGVEAARGDYVAFLDADDWWLPEHIETLQRLIANYPDASLLSTAHMVCRGGRMYRPRSAYPDGWEGMVDDFFERYACGLSLINSITACVNRSDFWAVGGFPAGIRRGPDIICWINMALAYRVAHAEVMTAVYYQDAVNRSDRLREYDPPGSLQHMAKLLQAKTLTDQQQAGIKLLFDRIAFFTSAGFRANGDLVGLTAIRRLSWQTGRFRLWILTAVLRLIPAALLRLAKKIRHPRVR